jgi:hypothetical protein
MQFSHVTIDGSSIGICGLNMHCAMSFQLQKRPKRIPLALLQGIASERAEYEEKMF